MAKNEYKQCLGQIRDDAGHHHHPAPAPSWRSFFHWGTSTSAAKPASYIAAMPSQGYQLVTPPPPQLPVGGQDQYTEFLALAAVDLAKKGARLHGSLPSYEMVASYKRKRDEQSAPVLGMAHAQQQAIIVDQLLLNHASKMWKDLAKERQRHMKLVASTAEERAAKRLNAKDEEIKHITFVNSTLQEDLKWFRMQAQMWGDVARSKEAAANALRGDLQRVLDKQVDCGVSGGVDDASSCCWGDYHVDFCTDKHSKVRKPEAVVASIRLCKGCGKSQAVELLLPCRLLSVCVSCAATVKACPACECEKTGNICINFS